MLAIENVSRWEPVIYKNCGPLSKSDRAVGVCALSFVQSTVNQSVFIVNYWIFNVILIGLFSFVV